MTDGHLIAPGEDEADEIEIRQTYDGRVGLVLQKGERLMHAPLHPDAARQIANIILRAADLAENSVQTPETLN